MPSLVASATPSPPPPGEIHSLQSQASALSAKITNESEQEQIAAEHYDAANTEYAGANARLATIRASLVTERRRTDVAERRVRATAVAAYVLGDSAAAQFSTMLTKNVNDAATISTYANVATDTLHQAVLQLQKAQQSSA